MSDRPNPPKGYSDWIMYCWGRMRPLGGPTPSEETHAYEELAELRRAAEAWEALEQLVTAGGDVTIRRLRQGMIPVYEADGKSAPLLRDAVLAAAKAGEEMFR